MSVRQRTLRFALQNHPLLFDRTGNLRRSEYNSFQVPLSELRLSRAVAPSLICVCARKRRPDLNPVRVFCSGRWFYSSE